MKAKHFERAPASPSSIKEPVAGGREPA